MQAKSIFWFRRDLRLEDNVALFHALQSADEVLPIFIYDTDILDDLPKDDARVAFIADALERLNAHLLKFNTNLATFHGKPIQVFEKLIRENNIQAVFSNRDYEPYALRRDNELKDLFAEHNIGFFQFKDHVIFEQNEIVKEDGSPYIVFTPFSKKWKQQLNDAQFDAFPSKQFLHKIAPHSYPFICPADFGFTNPMLPIPMLNLPESLANYDAVRNFPGLDQTTKLSVHLRFGTVSIRKVVALARLQSEPFLNELIWREFFIQILWHYPQTVRNSFKPKYDRIRWRNNEAEFKAWCDGNTGYPIVDAGMRELNVTGFMQNRVRMIVASFLCKHLLIDWRWGETYFALKLLDYEQASNVGNWQWAAGSGVDAAPYFRIFNPSEQVKKFDKQHSYILKWVPELNEMSYPEPIVDHKEARERCLRVYKEALA